MAKRRLIEKGFSASIATLGAILLLNGLFAYYRTTLAKNLEGPSRACEETRWTWVRTSQELEGSLRQWARMAADCLRAGFIPIEAMDEGGSYAYRRLEGAEPVIGPPKFPYVGISAQANFLPGKPSALCYEGVFIPVVIRRVNSGDEISTVQLEFQNQVSIPEHIDRFFLIQYSLHQLELLPRKGEGKFLADRSQKGSIRPIASRLEEFEASIDLSEFGESLEGSFYFGEGDCSWERPIEISLGAEELQGQRWIVEENDLYPRPKETPEGGS